MLVHGWTADQLRYEPDYAVRAVRLPTLPGVDPPYAGGAWVVVEPGSTMARHVNPGGESELFFIVEGAGTVEVDGARQRVGFGDTVPIPPHRPHSLIADPAGRLVFLSLWWGGQSTETAAEPATKTASDPAKKR